MHYFGQGNLSLPKHAILLFATDTVVVHQLSEIDSECPFLYQHIELQRVARQKTHSISATSKASMREQGLRSAFHERRSIHRIRNKTQPPTIIHLRCRQIQGRHAARGRGRVRSEGCAREVTDGRHSGGQRAGGRGEPIVGTKCIYWAHLCRQILAVLY